MADLALVKEFSPDCFCDQVRRHDAPVFNCIGTMITNLHNTDPPDDADNLARYGIGANAPIGVINEFEPRFDVRLVEGDGLTETATVATLNPIGAPRQGSVGKALPHIKLEIVNKEGQPLPPGEEGEIAVCPPESNSFIPGYHNQSKETVDAWQNLWFCPGDTGYRDEDGYFYFIDRKAYAIQQPGGSISSYEIESVLSDLPT